MDKPSEVLWRARDSFMEELGEGNKMPPMLLMAAVLHVLRAAKNDVDLANKALSYLPPHQDRFDRAIELAEAEESKNG